MFVSPSKIKRNRILKNRILNFETVKKTHGNLVLIATDKQETMEKVLASKLLRPQQLMSAYVPRLIKPMKRKIIRLNQKEIYKSLKVNSKGKIKIVKTMLSSYSNRNLAYNIVPEYTETLKLASTVKAEGLVLQKYMTDYFGSLISNIVNDVNYEKNYIIFPMDEYIEKFRYMVYTAPYVTDPVALFLKGIRRGFLQKEDFKDIDGIIFFNPNARALIAVDLNDTELSIDEKFSELFLRINRLNEFNNNADSLSDIVEDDVPEEEDSIENTKEEIKKIVLDNVAKTLKAGKFEDFESATKDEQDLILSIDRRIDSYLSDEANIEKPFTELVATIEQDRDIKTRAIKYIETKKVSEQKLSQLSKNLEKEVEVINSITELDAEDAIITPDVFDVKDVDVRIKESTLSSFDEEYNIKQSKKDLTAVLTGFSSSDYLPMTLQNLEIEDTSDDFNQRMTIRVKYKTDEGRNLSFSLDYPKMVDKRFFYVNGNKKLLLKQLVRLPLVKTKADRVELTTNYNKVTFERTAGKLSRKNAYLLKILKDYEDNPNVHIVYGDNLIANNEFKNDFEYEELSENITSIKTIKYDILFNRNDINAEVEIMDLPDNFILDGMTPFGTNNINDALLYIQDGEIYEAINEKGSISINKISEDLFGFINTAVLGRKLDEKLPTIGKSFVYSKMKIFGTSYPVFAVVGFMNGITDILKRYEIDYKLSETRMKIKGEYVEVRFKDKYLYYRDTIKNTLLLNVLYAMDTENYDFDEFDMDQPYSDFFLDKLDQPIYIKNTLKLNLGLILDPITKEILKDLKMSTDIIDIFLEANTLLTNNSFRPQNDIRNYRIRGNEVVFAKMYQILADAYRKYQNYKMNGGRVDSLDIPRDSLIRGLMGERNVNEHSTLNPVLEMENIAAISAKGFRGINLDDAFTLELRSYDQSMVGFIAGNATPHGNAGVTRSLTYNPKINSVRGYVTDIDNKAKLEPSNLLSPAEMLAAFTSTQADPTRQAMQIGQTKHTMPTKVTNKQLIGSGVNKTMAFMISDDFAFKAKNDGIIESIDEETNIAILKYINGERDAIDLSEVFVKNSNSGFYINQKFAIVYKVNEKFKKGDVIAYNPSFFSGKGKDVDYQPGTLAKVAIAAMDLAYEDSTMIAETLSDKAASKVVMLKPVSLGVNTIVHKMMKVGEEVKVGDHLVDFTASFDDPSTSEFLVTLAATIGQDEADIVANEHISSKYTGRIADIKIYYNMPIEELNPSLQKLIKDYKNRIQKKKTAVGEVKSSNIRIPPTQQQTSDKVGVEEYEGVLVEFYVEYYDEMGTGDKLTYSTALKGIVSKVVTKDEAPISEYRPEEIIEAIQTPTGIISRMTIDLYSMLYGNKVLIELGKQIKEIMEDKR